MSLVQLKARSEVTANSFALFSLGFRPYFIGAAVFSFVSIFTWMLVYGLQLSVDTGSISLFEWHAHQMIYGFSMAVIAGFLLTATMNWTGVQTLQGASLMALLFCWAVPRAALLLGTPYIKIAALFELLFITGLACGIAAPIIKSKQWRQLGILTKVILLGACNLCFYLDAFGYYSDGAFIAVYGGLFFVISLILTIGGRVMPIFIRNGIDQAVEVSNPLWVAITSLFVFLIFTVNFLFIHHQIITGITAGLLFGLTTYRLICWHTPKIWSKPLLWSLFSSFLFIDLGFLFFALHSFFSLSVFIGVHAFAFGGIGLATLAMMIRVSLGHTGRNVRTPSRGAAVLLAVLLSGSIVRVFLPILTTEYYRAVILASQILWMIAFAGFLVLHTRMLITSRIDGQPG